MKECLFCLKTCPGAPTPPEGGIVGATNCKLLEDQLLQHFVLRKLLDIPWVWCEESLQRHSETGLPNLISCRKCSDVVNDAWSIHQRLVGLEVRLEQMKQKIKGTMLESIRRVRKRKLRDRGDWKNQVRMLIFPDEMDVQIRPKKRFNAEENVDDEAEFFSDYPATYGAANDDDVMEFNDSSEDPLVEIWSENENLHTSSTKLKNRKKKIRLSNKHKVFKRKRKFVRHKGESLRKEDKRIKCKTCPAKCEDEEELQNHLTVHNNSKELGLECETCSFPARTSEELELHKFHDHNNEVKKFSRPFACGVGECAFKADAWRVVKEHADKEHPDTPKDELGPDLQLKCALCSKFFETGNTLINHQKKMHPDLFGAPLESIQCSHCSMLLPSRIHLQYHLKAIHKRLNNYICDVCGKGFSYPRRLERHKIMHEKKLDYVCHLCGCSYTYNSSLSAHYRKFHPEVEQFTNPNIDSKPALADSSQEFSCKYCDLKFPFKITMIRHLKTHKETIGVQCDICSKYYINAQGLRQHMKLNHSTSDQQTKCPHCFKLFPNPHAMHTHSVKHCKIKKINESSSSIISTTNTQSSTPAVPPSNSSQLKQEIILSTQQPDVSHLPEAPTISVVFHIPVSANPI